MQYPKVSIMIATYNSEKLLPRTLDSIVQQSYPKEQLEILIVDGGSSDKTIRIAEEYGCTILKNDKTEPVNAKLIGARNATGKYLITLDHDEVFDNKRSIEIKINAALKHQDCKAILGSGYIRPKDYPGLNEYISEFGDPFSLFIYNFPKGVSFFEKVLKKRYDVVCEDNEYMVVSFKNAKKLGIIELCCLGTMIDLEYFRGVPEAFDNPNVMVHLFYVMLREGHSEIIVTKNDGLVHYSADSIKAYLPKLKWRICNNIHFEKMAASGYSGREDYCNNGQVKKYLYVIYTALTIPCIIHAIFLTLTRKNSAYLLHPFFCWYVLIQIVYQYARKVLKRTPQFTSYDGKAKIDNESRE